MNSLQLKNGYVISNIFSLEERITKGQPVTLFFTIGNINISSLISELTEDNLGEIKIFDGDGNLMETVSYKTFRHISKSYNGADIKYQISIE